MKKIILFTIFTLALFLGGCFNKSSKVNPKTQDPNPQIIPEDPNSKSNKSKSNNEGKKEIKDALVDAEIVFAEEHSSADEIAQAPAKPQMESKKVPPAKPPRRVKNKNRVYSNRSGAMMKKSASAPYSLGSLGAGGAMQYKGMTHSGSGWNDVYYQPTPHNTESYDHIAENGYRKVSEHPLSTFSIDVDAASYANMRRFINNSQLPPKDAVRLEEMINYFNYDYPNPEGKVPFSVNTELSDCPWNPKHKLIHIGLQGKKVDTKELPASNLVFLLDVSGSMSSANKLPLLKKAFKMLVKQLRPEDRVSIVVYAGAAGVVLPSTPGNQTSTILGALERLNAGGSTAGGAGIKLAYKIAKENYLPEGNNRVILATDGDFNVGASSNAEMIRLIEEKRKTGIFLTALGFGMGNYKDSKMEKIANKGNGHYAYIDNILEAKKVMLNEMGGTLLTIAKDVKIQVEFNPHNVQAYRLVGYENRLLNKEDFNDDKKDAGELGAGHTVTALYEIVPPGVELSGDAVDALKYQTPSKKSKGFGNELLTVKLRYKLPKAEKSTKVSFSVKTGPTQLAETSNNFRFSAAVASFGMLLRDSKYKGSISEKNVLQLAKNSKGKDSHGYRAEFIRLVEMAEILRAQKKLN